MKIPNKIKAILPVRIAFSTYNFNSVSIKKLQNGTFKRYYTCCTSQLCNYKIRKCLDKGSSNPNSAYFEVPENQIHFCRRPLINELDSSSEENDESEIHFENDDESEIISKGTC